MQSQRNGAEAPSTDAQRYALSPTRRWRTRHRGISYRLGRDLSRSYFAFDKGKHVPAGTTEKEALAKQADLRSRRARGERVIVASRIAFKAVAEEWYEDCVRRGLRAGTLQNYRSDLDRLILPMFGERGVASISPQDIVDFVRDLEKRTFGRKKKTPKPSTIANALKPLNGTLGFAVFKGYVASNAMAQVPSGHKPSCNTSREHREWTTEEVERVIEEARKRDARGDARQSYALAIEVLLRAGLRLGEMLGLRFMDIDFEASVLLIRNSWTKAGTLGPVKTASSVRRVPVAPGLLQQLAARSLEMDADPDTFVFARKKGENPPAQSNFRQRAWLPVIEDAGLTDGPRVTPHDARHAFASQLADLDLSSSDLAPILGHSTSGITEAIYVHAFNRDAREDRVRKAMEVAAGATADQQ